MPAHKMNSMNNVREALLWASSFLGEAGTKDPRFEAELIIRHVLRMNRANFLASMPDPIKDEEIASIRVLLERRAAHEPIQYILGEQNFYGRDFIVAPGVLIPRPETELLIEQVLLHSQRIWSAEQPLSVVDFGTGSGAITLTLAAEKPNWQLATVDISLDAIAIAKKNAERLDVAERVRFIQGDLVEPILDMGERVDILVSNPPYIPSTDVDELDKEVLGYEPRLALDGGTDGYIFYRRICEALPRLLAATALVAFEVGIYQAEAVAQLMKESGAVDEVFIYPDLAGIDRIIVGYRLHN
ncbi:MULTISPECIES: peptide chain release factor N(5)-glutamine methyltransferase [Brevibacillus]|uniref:peptide chain release factor N(5)-glutamine methyltransferase n=1 Tax=Brevibacillus TaxID=55080 RepID=UPI000E2EFF6B|nr:MULTISPECIES: peptide chain release factor N(5)-glutamine methyltransferase [Brevibacillus]MED1786324.1 peptide chain release factor N(5)-glutamine methyltransferase [Brevibacillus laterosporus]RFB36000.1 peptide chain release factor N(5)-glutamine methyltransferase [Brevibacillus sp. VP]